MVTRSGKGTREKKETIDDSLQTEEMQPLVETQDACVQPRKGKAISCRKLPSQFHVNEVFQIVVWIG